MKIAAVPIAGGLCSPVSLPAGSDTFKEMYASDGNHPSPAGTYLQGLIIASSMTGDRGGSTAPIISRICACFLKASECQRKLEMQHVCCSDPNNTTIACSTYAR